MTLNIHLYITLQHGIDLKSFTVMSVVILGSKTILVALTHLGRVEELKKNLTTVIKSLPIISFEEQV